LLSFIDKIDLPEIVPNVSLNAMIWASFVWLGLVIILVIIWIATSKKKKKAVDVSALAALASSDQSLDTGTTNADPKEVMAILSIERVAASTALSAVKDASKNKRISSRVASTLTNRYKQRIAKIDSDMKRRSGAQEYQSLAETLEQSRDRIRGKVMPKAPTSKRTPPPPPPSPTPGIPATAPPVRRSAPPTAQSGVSSIPKVPTAAPPKMGTPPTKPSSPIPTPPKIPTVGPPTAKPTTVVPPSIAPPTVSTPPMPPKAPTTSPSRVAPPTTSDLVPPPVPTATSVSSPGTAPATSDSDTQSISGLRMEMLRELARLKKFMSEEG